MRQLLLVVLCLVVAGCGDGFVNRPTRVVFDPGVTDFWSVPLPSELRRQTDGSYNLDRWPGPRPNLVKMWLDVLDKRITDGWGVNAGAFFTTTADIDVATLPPSATDSLKDDASVLFVDIDPQSPEYGRRFPIDVTFASAEIVYQPARLLAVVPVFGFTRRPSTTYAVLITDRVKDTAGVPLGRTEAFHKAFEKQEGANATAADTLAPIKTWAKDKKFDTARIVGATVFKTIDPSSILSRLASWIESVPAPTLAVPFTQLVDYPDFTVYTAKYKVPHIQSGPKPGRGTIVWSADGQTPVQQGTQDVRLSIAVPKTAMPAAGYPLTLYFHGSGGEYLELIDRGPLDPSKPRNEQGNPPLGSGPSGFLAKRGMATMGFDFPLHGDRETPPDMNGQQLYNILNDIDSSVDNMQVAAMEALYLTRLIGSIRVSTPGGEVKFDMSRLAGMGHSMGTTLGIPIAAFDTRIKGYVFSGAGAMLIELANTTTYPLEIKGALELILGLTSGQSISRSYPLLHAFQSLWDYTDPSAKARHVAKDPLGGRPAKPFFQPQGFIDGYFHPVAQQSVAVSLGATLVGDELEPLTAAALKLDGRPTQATFPLKKNLNGVTAGVTQLSTPFELGHYVLFDVETMQHQVACFLDGVGTAEGPAIVAPGPLSAPCE
ncbi:MAG: hypothetical protein JNG84_08305 [Archangium sp.]|nr:hypothetical protein [Archangium sp.]